MNLIELAQQAGINPKWAAGTAGGEYHSSCPICGGDDRFYIQPFRKMKKCSGTFRCRQCGVYGDAIQFACMFLNYSYQEALQVVEATVVESCEGYFKHYKSNNFVALQKPPEEWMINASELVCRAHESLLKQKNILCSLADRGLPLQAVQRYRLGWIPEDQFLLRTNWGLAESVKSNGQLRALWIPQGIIIPTIEHNGAVVRLKVRRFNWRKGDAMPKYIAISGSMNGLSLVGFTGQQIMIVVESELDAYAIDFVANDITCTVAVGSNIKNPDNVINRIARNTKYLLICHDNDDAGLNMYTKWKKLYSHAISSPTPIGKDIGEAIQQGFNMREWLLRRINS